MERLHRSTDIASMFTEVKPQYLGPFQVYIRLNTLSQTRAGIIISKKHIPLAVKRNRLRRQLRELIRKSIITKTNTYDILILMRHRIKEEDYPQIHKQLFNSIITLT